MPVVEAPKRAKDSESKPPPHPISKAFKPAKGRPLLLLLPVALALAVDVVLDVNSVATMFRIYCTRMAFIYIRGFFCGSHHDWSIPLNLFTSCAETDDDDDDDDAIL